MNRHGMTDFLPLLDALKKLQRTQRIFVRQPRELLGIRIQFQRAFDGQVERTGIGDPM